MIVVKMGSDKWTRKSTHQLIELFEANQCLWNLSHDEYKNKLARKRAIDGIASVLNMNPADIKLKIHRLRTQFSNERNRIKRAKMEGGKEAKRASKWDYYNHLIFLLFKNNVKTEVKDDPLETTKTQLTNIEIYKQDDDSHSEHDLLDEVLSENGQQSSKPQIEPISEEDFSTITILHKTSKDSKFLNYEMETEQHASRGTDNMNNTFATVGEIENEKLYDEDEIFGKYIGSELRQLGKYPDLRFKLKNGIQRLMWEISTEYSRRSVRVLGANRQKNQNSSNFHELDQEEVFLLQAEEE